MYVAVADTNNRSPSLTNFILQPCWVFFWSLACLFFRARSPCISHSGKDEVSTAIWTLDCFRWLVPVLSYYLDPSRGLGRRRRNPFDRKRAREKISESSVRYKSQSSSLAHSEQSSWPPLMLLVSSRQRSPTTSLRSTPF